MANDRNKLALANNNIRLMIATTADCDSHKTQHSIAFSVLHELFSEDIEHRTEALNFDEKRNSCKKLLRKQRISTR